MQPVTPATDCASADVSMVSGYGVVQVAEAAVIGTPHKKWGERPLLIVVAKRKGQLTGDDMLQHLQVGSPLLLAASSSRAHSSMAPGQQIMRLIS